MQTVRSPLLVALLALAGAACALPVQLRSVGMSNGMPVLSVPTQPAGFVRELKRLYVVLPDETTVLLDTLITRPVVQGRLPLVLISHGSPRDPSDRGEMTPTAFSARAMAFARRGYAVAVVLRRGYGRSEGTFVEAPGRCRDRDYLHASSVAADDLLGALRTLSREEWVDPTHVVLVGHSAGGMTSLAAAAASPEGVLGTVSFAGGRGSDTPDHVCQPERLVRAMAELGKRTRTRSLWIYSENDHFFDPILAHRMEAAYASGGGPVEFVELPPFGDDGHMFFSRAKPEEWWALVGPFLASIGLPSELLYPQTPVVMAAPPGLSPDGVTAFADYLVSDGFEKAFAVGESGWGDSLGRRTAGEAAERALKTCREHSQGCVVYAIGNARAPQ